MAGASAIKDLVQTSGAKILSREPHPEHVDTTYFLYHCPPGHAMENTSTVILYDNCQSEQPKLKYNMNHIKTLTLAWFYDCIEKFEICEPY